MTFYLGGVYSIPEGNSRASWYGFSGTPAVMFDGTYESIGGQESGSMYSTYLPMVANRMGMSSPLVMNAAFVSNGNDMTVTVNIQVDEAISNTNNEVFFFVCQEGYHGQSNMVVDMLPTEAFTLSNVGQSAIVSRDFTLGSSFTEEDMRLIILVQNMSTKEILQATIASADYSGTLIVDAEPNGVDAPWRLQGPEGLDFTGHGDRSINLFFTGDYTLTFLDVPAWTLPANNPQTLTLVEDGTINFTGVYTDGPFTLVNDGPLANAGSGQGVALIDYDNDGDLDIHVLNSGTADQLLRNDGDLQFTDAATGWLADGGAGSSSAWADFNHDGNLDVLIGRNGEANLLFTGDGAGGFMPANVYGIDDAGPASSVSFVDYDLDGKLDIYVGNYGQANLLLQNFGDIGGGLLYFTNITGPQSDDGNTNGANWIDLNSDQRPDLYIVNSFSSNLILENMTIGFNDVTHSSGIDDATNGVGSAWGDYDNDGDFDLYLTNEMMADRLFSNSGEFGFNLVLGENASNTGNGRGVVWADFNNDTHLDLYVVRHNQADLFLLGNGTGDFQQIPVGPDEADGPGNAVACGDFDDDGDLDLFITRDGQSNLLLSNNLSADNNYFELKLTGSDLQPDAIGTIVRLTAGGINQMRHLSAGSGYLAMDSKTIHFGLGEITTIDELEITWPDGTTQSLTNLAANQIMQVTMGEDALSAADDDQTLPRATVLGKAHPNPFNPSTTIGFALAQSGPTRLDVFTVDGRRVRSLVSGEMTAGQHSVTWTGRDDGGRTVASGAYFYRLSSADGEIQTGRMVMVK